MTSKTQGAGQSDVYVRYYAHMSMGLDREGWAQTVDRLIHLHSRGNLGRFAVLVGIDPRTIRRWRRCQVDVSLDNVSKVAAATGTSVNALLKYSEWSVPEGEAADVGDDETRVVRAAQLDEATTRALLGYLADRQEREKRARIEDVEFFVGVLGHPCDRRMGS